MELILRLLQQKITTLHDVENLNEVQQNQLAHCLKMYFGKKTSFKTALKETCSIDLWEISEKSNPFNILYDFWRINGNSGGVFFANTLNETGVEMIQGQFDVQAAFIGKPESIALAEWLESAEKVNEMK